MEEILRSMHAKLIVQEMLISSLMIQLSKNLPPNIEFMRSVILPVEDELIAAQRDAPMDKRELAEATRQYLDEITSALLGKIPHGSKH
jgi:hypothetical protein